MKRISVLMILSLLTCAIGIHAAQKQSAKFLIPHEPVNLVGSWSLVKKDEDGSDSGCFLTIRSDHTLSILTGGLEADPPYTVIWMQEGNRIHFICPVVNQDEYGGKLGLDVEHLRLLRDFHSRWLRKGFGSGLSIFNYRGHILLIPEGDLAKVYPSEYPHSDYPVGWSFIRGNVTGWSYLFPSLK